MSERERLDHALVARGLFDSRARAQEAIAAGCVSVDGVTATKPAQKVASDAVIEARPAHPWVSRAALKLAHGLDVFGVDPAGRTCLDVGASTGGFTQVLLARGAARVVAVDVGRDQLHPEIGEDRRVLSLEGTDARRLTFDVIGGPVDLVVCDASFIGLVKVIAQPLALATPDADLIALFKPQFEVGPSGVGRGGLVRDGALIEAAFTQAVLELAGIGWRVEASTLSPIAGGDGNLERLIWARRASR